MIAIRSSKLAVCGALLVPFVLLGLAGHAGADPGPEPGVGRLAGADSWSVGALSTPKPAAPAASACRLVSTPFELDKDSDEVVWARLQNAGTSAVTLSALELGWRGSMVLAGVSVRPLGAQAAAVHAGPATSPALVALHEPGEHAGALTIVPGERLDLALTFDKSDDSQVLDQLVSTVAYLAEGCTAVVGAAPGDETPCPLELGPIMVLPADPRLARFAVANRSDTPVELASLEVAWPLVANGSLVALVIDGARSPLVGGIASSPAVIDLRRLGLAPVMVEGRAQTQIGLEFASAAAGEHYAVTVAARDGCVATTSTYVSEANPECGVEVVGFDIAGETARLRLSNGRQAPRVLTALDVFWPSEASGPLVAVRVNGVIAWTGTAQESPASVRLGAAAVIAARSTAVVQLVFKPVEEREAVASGHTGGDYTVVVTMQGGCRVVFSTLEGHPLGCSLSAGDVIVDPADKEARVALANAAADATLRQLAISWPARNGPLTEVRIDDVDLLDKEGEVQPGPHPFPIELRSDTVVIPRSSSRELALRFRDRASRNGYMFSLEFEAQTGDACQLLVTSRDNRPDCRLALGAPAVFDYRYVELALDNKGRDEVEIRFVTVDWPNDDLTNGLTQVALVDPARPEPLIVWQAEGSDGTKTRPPVQVIPNGHEAPILDPGKSVKLRLRFSGLLGGEMARPQDVMKVTVGTVEDCQASYSRDGQQLPPGLVTFGGVIRGLPQNTDGSGVFGTWLIETLGDEREVEVDRATRINPNTVTPKPGDLVAVEAILLDDERLRALDITFQLGVPGETLHGSIQDLDTEHPTPAWIRVADRHVYLVGGTLIHGGELEVNAEVSVDGKANPDGSVTAVRITVNKPPAGVEVEFTGVIQSRTTASEIDGEEWAVDKYVVVIPRRFVPDPSGPDPELRPADGKRVRVVGQLEGRKILATQHPEILSPPDVTRVSGAVAETPSGGLLGEWVLDTPTGEIRFAVDSLAVVDTRSAPAEAGMVAEAIIQEVAGKNVALRLRLEWP